MCLLYSCPTILKELAHNPQPQEKVKDLEQKVANLFMDNVALTTKLKASREVERQQQEETTSLKEELMQASTAQVSMFGQSY